jgi:hypothetical protein
MDHDGPLALPVLETARLRLRTLRLDDVMDQHAYAREPDIAAPGMCEPRVPAGQFRWACRS